MYFIGSKKRTRGWLSAHSLNKKFSSRQQFIRIVSPRFCSFFLFFSLLYLYLLFDRVLVRDGRYLGRIK